MTALTGIIFTVLALFFLFTPNSAYAVVMTSTINPPRIYLSDLINKITLTIDTSTDFFVKTYTYRFGYRYIDGNESIRAITSTFPDVQTSRRMSITIDGRVIPEQVGTFEIVVWYGNNQNDIAFRTTFQVEQNGGGFPSIKPAASPVQINTIPKVLIENLGPGNTYSFWWDRESRIFEGTAEIITKVIKPYAALQEPVDIGTNPARYNQDWLGNQKLCMEIGDYSRSAGLTCHYYALFNFTREPQPTFAPTPATISTVPQASPGQRITVSWNNPWQRTSKTSIRLFPAASPDESGIALMYLNSCTNIPGSDIAEPNSWCSFDVPAETDSGDYELRLFWSDGISTKLATTAIQITTTLPTGTGSDPTPTIGTAPRQPPRITAVPAAGQPCDPTTGNQNAGSSGVMTAIGCIPTDPLTLTKGLLRFTLMGAGGVALLLMIAGSFQMITSAGNPDNVKKGREQFTSAVAGLLFIIFSVLLLQVIGADILDIPGFKP